MDGATRNKNRLNNLILRYLGLVLLTLLPVISTASYFDDILLVVNEKKITGTEFKRLWEKNNLYTEPQSVDEYMELFINFHLKVAHAMDEGIHLEEDFSAELEGYRRRLAAPYLGDTATEEALVREAYERLLNDVNASHILVRLNPGYSPEDTLKTWEKAMQIRERIETGESFEEVARATSDDPSAKTNSGNLGYFTAFQMVYPFENAVYRSEPGELTMPVRTRFGYHIIRVNDRRKSRGELKTAHIMIGFNRYDESEAMEKVRQVHRDLMAGQSFELAAREHSTDMNSSTGGGVLPWFGSGRIVPEFEKAAFSLEKPGEISEPVRTAFGWHIVKLLERRDIPPFEEIRRELHERIRESGDERSQLIRSALVERLKHEWQFSENPEALEALYSMFDESIFSGSWRIPEGRPLNEVLFSITGQRVTRKDFAVFISRNAPRRNPWPIDEYIHSLFHEFVTRWLIGHEDRNLENKYPEFRYLMQEYRDGMLLFEITDRQVWSKAATDSAGLAAFHAENRTGYMWGTRLSATVFSAEDSRTARRGSRRAVRSLRSERRDNEWIAEPINRRSEDPVITYEEGLFSKGDDHLTDRAEWIEGVSEIFHDGSKFRFILIHDVLDPEPMTLEEARGSIISDYQDHLEKQWINSLRSRYNVEINRDVLSEIKKQLL